MIKALTKLGIKRMYHNIIKSIYDKPIANIISSGEKVKPFPLRTGMKQGCPITHIPTQNRFGISSWINKRRRRNKRNASK
jgi:hypothetical protein